MKRSAFLWSTGIKYSQRLCGDTAELLIILTKSKRDATVVVPHYMPNMPVPSRILATSLAVDVDIYIYLQ
jgi:hypothetical protein